jgi:hypothetical protein
MSEQYPTITIKEVAEMADGLIISRRGYLLFINGYQIPLDRRLQHLKTALALHFGRILQKPKRGEDQFLELLIELRTRKKVRYV